MTEETDKKTIVICDMQPVTSEGLRFVLNADDGLAFAGSLDSLDLAMLAARTQHPDIFLIDKGFGMQAVLDWIPSLKLSGSPYPTPSVVVWGVSMTEAEALRMMQAGAQGVMRKTADPSTILSCLRTVAGGAHMSKIQARHCDQVEEARHLPPRLALPGRRLRRAALRSC